MGTAARSGMHGAVRARSGMHGAARARSTMHSTWHNYAAQHSPAWPSSAPAALGDWEQFLIKEGFPSNAQGRNVNKTELSENLQD